MLDRRTDTLYVLVFSLIVQSRQNRTVDARHLLYGLPTVQYHISSSINTTYYTLTVKSAPSTTTSVTSAAFTTAIFNNEATVLPGSNFCRLAPAPISLTTSCRKYEYFYPIAFCGDTC